MSYFDFKSKTLHFVFLLHTEKSPWVGKCFKHFCTGKSRKDVDLFLKYMYVFKKLKLNVCVKNILKFQQKCI